MSLNMSGKSDKPKLSVTNEERNDPYSFKNSPKTKKSLKRQRSEATKEEDVFDFEAIRSCVANDKKETAADERKEKINKTYKENTSQTLMDVMDHQLMTRKNANTKLLKSLSEVMTQLEADHEVLTDNEPKIEKFCEVLVQCIKQATAAQNQKLKALKDICASYKKEVEGLLARGAMRPDDRPLWFDVYKAFPPITEPKFAQPKPEINPIKPILYHEDNVRAKLHSQGHGLGTVNMLNPAGVTHTKRLVQEYEKLKSEGVPESELVEKTLANVGKDRQLDAAPAPHVTAKNPNSVSAQVLADADLKNIFKQEK